MRKFIALNIFVCALCVGSITVAQTPSPAMTATPVMAPAPMVAPVMAPVPMVVPMATPVVAAPTMASPVAVAPVAAPAVVPVPIAAPVSAPAAPAASSPAPVAPAPVAAPASPTIVVKAPEPVYKSAAFWISVVGGPLLSIILGILVAFGVINKKHIKFLQDNQIVKIADKVCTQIENFTEGTDNKWDDALALAVRAVVDRMGTLTEDQEALVKKVVEGRKAQAASTTATSVAGEEKKEA